MSDAILKLQVGVANGLGLPSKDGATIEQIRFIFLKLRPDLLPDRFKRTKISAISDAEIRNVFAEHRPLMERHVEAMMGDSGDDSDVEIMSQETNALSSDPLEKLCELRRP